MPGRQDIKAGSAYVELLLRNNAFTKGLRAARQRLGEFGAGVAGSFKSLGGQIGNLAGRVTQLATKSAGILQFAAVTGALDDVSRATGIAAKDFAKLGAALEIAGGTLGVVAAAAGVLLNPIGLVTVALAAGLVAWTRYTESGQEAFATLTEALAPFWETFKTTFQGIKDALAAGELKLAGQIAMAGLRLAWAQGLDRVNEQWQTWKATTLEIVNQAKNGIAIALIEAAYSIQRVWLKAKAFFLGLFETITTGAERAIAKVRELAAAAGGAGAARALFGTGKSSQQITAESNARRAAIQAELNRDTAAATSNGRGAVGQLQADSRRRSEEIAANRRQATIGSAGQAAADLAGAQAELRALSQRAAAARTTKEQKESQQQQKAAAAAAIGSGPAASQIAGTFSAGALAAMGQGLSGSTGPMARTEKKLDLLHATLLLQLKQEQLQVQAFREAWRTI